MSWDHDPPPHRRGYHHGNLKEALVRAALDLIAEKGPAGFTFADAARSAGVSPAAPYRHFVDRRALLSTLAAEGFTELAAVYRKAIGAGKTPRTRLAVSGRAYLAFAAERPQLFWLMFASDLFDAGPLDPALTKAAGDCYQVFEGLVAATLGDVCVVDLLVDGVPVPLAKVDT